MTVYVPLDVTVIEGVVSVVDQAKFVPDAVNIDEPQLSTTVTIGALGIAIGAAVPNPFALTQPPTV